MAETNLSFGFWALMTRVSQYLGYGDQSYEGPETVGGQLKTPRGEEFRRCRLCVNSGYRQFLYPPPLNGRTHNWSFLAPLTSLTFTSGIYQYDLPDDFAGLLGQFNYDENVTSDRIETTSHNQLMAQRAACTASSGYPQIVALVPKTFAAATGQRWQAHFWPTPDGAYKLWYRYQVMPAQLGVSRVQDGWCTISGDPRTTLTDSGTNNFTTAGVAANDKVVLRGSAPGGPRESAYIVQSVGSATVLTLYNDCGGLGECAYEVLVSDTYCQGGAEHSETILASVLAFAERMKTGTEGSHDANFLRLLSGSIGRDLDKGPKHLGKLRGGRENWNTKRWKSLWYGEQMA